LKERVFLFTSKLKALAPELDVWKPVLNRSVVRLFSLILSHQSVRLV
jgi:hypothetical protein